MDTKKKAVLKTAAIFVLEHSMEDYEEFTAWSFKQHVAAAFPEFAGSLPSSVMRPLWDYRKSKKKTCSFICVNPDKAVYQKIPLADWDEEAFLQERKDRQVKSCIKILESYGYTVSKKGA